MVQLTGCLRQPYPKVEPLLVNLDRSPFLTRAFLFYFYAGGIFNRVTYIKGKVVRNRRKKPV